MSKVLKAVLLLVCMACLSCVAAAEAALPPGYELAAQNDQFYLYLKQDTLSIIVESKSSGSRLYSSVQNPENSKDNDRWKGFYQSGIVMEYINGTSPTLVQADLLSVPNEITCEKLGNGFDATVLFPDIGISYRVIVTLDDKGVTAVIPQADIKEERPDEFTVSSFYVFPFLGHSYKGKDAGYMLIPDGQGALIRLEDNEGRFTSPFTRTVYDTNIGVEEVVSSRWAEAAEPVIMPVFGMAHTEKEIGFLSVIEGGDVGAQIMAYPNGVRLDFDWICAKYTYRMVYAQPMGPSSGTVSMRTEYPRSFDIVQHFLLLDGEDAGYTGMACAYRDYLDERQVFENADAQRPFDVQLELVGLEQENAMLGKQDVVMTSFAQAEAMVRQLHEQGVGEMNIVYRGWLSGGLSGGLPTDGYAPAAGLGGRAGLEQLCREMTEIGVPVYLEADFLTLNTETHWTLAYSALKKITCQTYTRQTFGKAYETLSYLAPDKSLEIARSVIDQFVQAQAPGIALTGTTKLVTDYYYGNGYRDSSQSAAQYRQICELAQSALPTQLAAANAYLWSSADALRDIPIADSDYTYTDQTIPFLAMVLSGRIPYYAECVNFQANTDQFLLSLIEQGARPCFLLTQADAIELQNTNSSGIYSSQYGMYEGMIIDWYHQLSQIHEKIDGASIIGHAIEADMVRVTWDNGARIYLNYGEKDGVMDGVALPGLSYKVVCSDDE